MKLVPSCMVATTLILSGCGGSDSDSPPVTSSSSSIISSSSSSVVSSSSSSTVSSTSSSDESSSSSSSSVVSGTAPIAGDFSYEDSVPEVNCSQVFTSASELEDAANTAMTAGTTLCLADGNYSGLELAFGGNGTADSPITIAAENPGAVTVSGEVRVKMGGSYAVLQGFIFKDGAPGSSELISTRLGSGELCNHCRITEVSIIDMNVDGDDTSKWVYDYGAYTRIDHNWFAGKTSRGALLVVDRWIPDGTDPTSAQIDYAKIDHNYFGDRAPTEGKAYADSGDNEYEAVRIGLSTSHTGDSFSVVAHNYFERIEGEAEVISNKAGNNSIVHNTIRDSYGSITTRHGANTTITNNFIFGDDHPFAGGLRIIDGGHTVTNNYIEGARYKNTTHHGGIVLMGSDSSPSDSGYQQLENVLVAHNTVVDSVNSLNVDGGKKSNNPRDVFLVNNIIDNAIGPIITQAADGMPGGSSVIAGNIVYGTDGFSDDSGLTSVAGITEVDAQLEKGADGLWRPSANSPNLDAVAADTGSFAAVSSDMDGQARAGTTLAGADHPSSDAATSFPLTSEMVGPKSYTPPKSKGYVVKVPIANHDFDSSASSWDFIAPASVTTDDAETFSRGSSAKAEGNGWFSQEVTLAENTNYTLSAFVLGLGQLAVTLDDGTQFDNTEDSSEFEFRTLSFNSGANTSATIFGRLPETATISVDIENANFDDDVDNGWSIIENSGDDKETQGLGDVGDSSNNASSDDSSGSAKIGYRYAADSGSTPGLYQVVDGLAPNTEHTLSVYLLVKDGYDSSVTFGVKDEAGASTIASKSVDYDTLKNGGAPESAEDNYYQASLSFNSGSNGSVRVYAEYDARELAPEHNPGVPNEMSSDDRKIYELRIDDFTLEFQGAPPANATAVFDSFRLVSHESM